jgi:hypothetical protein
MAVEIGLEVNFGREAAAPLYLAIADHEAVGKRIGGRETEAPEGD